MFSPAVTQCSKTDTIYDSICIVLSAANSTGCEVSEGQSIS
jgi:hypothetical protein